MRHGFALLSAALLFLAPLLAASPAPPQGAQQPAAGGQAPAGRQGGVQVGVPDGRQGGGARQGGGGRQGGGRQAGPPAGPAPRSASGRVLLTSATPAQKGLWLPTIGINSPIAPVPTIPFQPWARALYADRQGHELEPHARCKASGVTRQFQTPYGVEFVDLPELQRIYIFDVGGPHTFRTIFMDGRSHPTDLIPSYYGHSIGWWEGDTLVVESTGFNERFWLDRRGIPHTEKMRTLERFVRTDANTIQYEVTIDDPTVYTAPWKGSFNLRWDEGTELFEYVCQQANYAHELMVGAFESVDRTTPIVP